MSGVAFADQRLVVTTKVEYPTSDVTGADMSRATITLVEEIGKHTIFSIGHLGTFSYFQDALRSGSPIKVTTSSAVHGDKSWFGYVDSVAPWALQSSGLDNTTQEAVRTEVLGVGLTYPLKQTSQQVWESTALYKVVESLAKREGLIALTDQDNLTQSVPQAGRSAWSVITGLGVLSGRIPFMTGTTLNWLRPETIFKHYSDSAPRLSYTRNLFQISKDPATLTSFEQSWSDNNSHNNDRWDTSVTVFGVDPVTGNVTTSTVGDGMFTQFLDETARSQGSVEDKALGAYLTSFPTTAEFSGPGNPLVAAGQPVFVAQGDIGNWWLVKKVTHTFDAPQRTHRMHGILMRRDSFPTEIPGAFPKVNLTRRMAGTCLCKETEPTLSSNYSPLVYGTGAWGQLPRWEANGRCSG